MLHCPYCHGFEVRDQILGVLGWTPGAATYAQIVRQWSNDVVYFASGTPLTATEREELEARSVTVIGGAVERVVIEEDRLRGLELDDKRVIELDALFVPPRFVPNNDLLVELGCDLDDNGWASTDATGRTSVSGVWVAGNVTNLRAQVITAAGEGSAAAIALNAELVAEDVARAVHAASGGSQQGHVRHQPDTGGIPMNTTTDNAPTAAPSPPSKHQLAFMIWLAVFPTLTVINLLFGSWLGTLTPVVRTFVLATVAVPIVIYGLMPHLHRAPPPADPPLPLSTVIPRACRAQPFEVGRARADDGPLGCAG